MKLLGNAITYIDEGDSIQEFASVPVVQTNQKRDIGDEGNNDPYIQNHARDGRIHEGCSKINRGCIIEVICWSVPHSYVRH